MQNPFQVRLAGLLIFLISVGCLTAAIYLQVSKDWFPCPLCIVQRYFYWFTALLGLMVFVSASPRRVQVRRLLPVLSLLTALGGAGVAFYHVWVLANPGQTCGVDPMQVWLNDLPWTSYWWVMFEADGLCTAEYPPFLGLSLPMWSGLGFLVQAALAVRALRLSRSVSVFKESR